ncbi:MAG: chemotaxis protein CheX [Gemmatimonadales bacterium]|nr:chemotaxis protein CheX [Gemmatimonadales bacterium]
MQNNTHETAGSTFLNVVEQLTFMFGESVPKSELEVDGVEFTLAQMRFNGDLPGVLSIGVPSEITAEIAANILGLEAEDIESKEMKLDALGEVLNVVCGHVIMALVGTGANFKLDSPEVKAITEEGCNELILNDDFTGFILDDSPVLLGLTLEN